MDFTLDDNTHAQVLKPRQFIKNKLQPLKMKWRLRVSWIPKMPLRFSKISKLRFYGMNIPTEYGGGGFNAVQMVYLEQRWDKPQIRLSVGPLGMFMKSFWLVTRLTSNSGCSLV